MSKRYSFQTIFILLILCMVSVWTAPMFLGTGTPIVEFAETDSDPFEFDEDLFLIDRDTEGMNHALHVRIGGTHLSMRPASLARVFPPPKPFYS